MSYIATVQKQSSIIELERQDHRANVRLDGMPYRLDWRKIAPLAATSVGSHSEEGRYSLLIAGRSYEIFARRLSPTGKSDQAHYEIWLNGERFEIAVEDERTHQLSNIAQSTMTSAATIQAPMPGLVASVLVKPGDNVTAGQPVAILEAMKMENDLPAPITGKVRAVSVNQGQTVDQGEVLVIIDPLD
jgi:biotin carboxyl carrier protein